MAPKLRTFLAELKRRHVYQVAAVYIVVGLGILGTAEVILVNVTDNRLWIYRCRWHRLNFVAQ